MIIKHNFYLIILTILLSWSFYPAYADSLKNDFGLWTAVNINTPITKKFQSRFQMSPRWLDNSTNFNQLILHALLGYKFNEHLSFFQGYAWSTLYRPNFTREQRPYQDLLITHNINKISLEHRFRFEERFLQDVEGISLRARYKLKGTYPLDKNEKWSLVLFDELFFNLNSHSKGPEVGLDQNRIYIGINHKFNENISSDLGYQLQQLNPPRSSINRFNHFIFFYLNFFLPALVSSKT